MMENLTDKSNKTLVSLTKPKRIRTASINLEQRCRNSKSFILKYYTNMMNSVSYTG